MFLRLLRITAVLASAAVIVTAQTQPPPATSPSAPGAAYNPAIFLSPIPRDQLSFVTQFDGAPANDLFRDKKFQNLIHSIVPNCIFHYGWDTPLADAITKAFKGSPVPVQIRDGRYLTVSGRMGPYLGGRGFIWIDLQDGIALGGFYFHPTNGEPTPALNILSKQIKEDAVAMSQLPEAFAEDLSLWSAQSRVSPVITRYLITGANKKILLEHDEDFCRPLAGAAPPQPICQQMNADAADIDLIAADYLEQTNHATNATAWTIDNPDAVAWIQVRNNSCLSGPDPLACRIVMTRERVHVILRRRLAWHSLAHK